jgi:hypothetical protein
LLGFAGMLARPTPHLTPGSRPSAAHLLRPLVYDPRLEWPACSHRATGPSKSVLIAFDMSHESKDALLPGGRRSPQRLSLRLYSHIGSAYPANPCTSWLKPVSLCGSVGIIFSSKKVSGAIATIFDGPDHNATLSARRRPRSISHDGVDLWWRLLAGR